jgi:hypothetical protein
MKHLLGYGKIRDDAVLHRPDRDDISRCATEHILGFLADGFHFIRDFVDRNDGRLIDDNASPFGIYERVGRSQINGEIAGKEAKKRSEIHELL